MQPWLGGPRAGDTAEVTRCTDDVVPPSRAALAAVGAVCAALDATVTSHGFLAGQPGASAAEGAVVFCAPWATFRRRLPVLAPLVEQASGLGDGAVDPATACIDLEVSVAVDTRTGTGTGTALDAGTGTMAAARLVAVRLEGRDLGTVAREVGRPDLAAELAALLQVPLAAAVPRLDAAVGEILSRGAGVGAIRSGH